MKQINILGINVNNIAPPEALSKIESWLEGMGQHQIVTPNPEIILRATSCHDEEFFYILNKADLALPDGVALKFAVWLMGKNIKRITGADLTREILKIARERNYKVAVFNWSGGLSRAEEIKNKLETILPGSNLYVQDIERDGKVDLSRAAKFSPDIVFCALGAPYQEKFIYHNLSKLPTAKIGLGVGGAFDFLSGKLKRAPKLMRLAGLEWLWRLIKQPKRWRRIFNAVMVFPCKFLNWRFILPFLYRRNVACLLYRKKTAGYEILLVERADEPGHWQLPQGGTDGQDAGLAGQRELAEELNTEKFKTTAVFKKLHQYEFGQMMSKFLAPAKLARGYRGHKQDLFIAEFFGSDADIKVNFWEHKNWRWVEAEKLIEAVHPVRRLAAKIFMEKFWRTVKEQKDK